MLNETSILYVEDDPLSREIMDMILNTAIGVKQLTILEDSDNFSAHLQSLDDIDIILLDIHMQPIDGFEMLEILRGAQQFDETKIIALTASVMNEEVLKLQQSGFDGGISKPVDIATLPDLLERVLNGETVWHIG